MNSPTVPSMSVEEQAFAIELATYLNGDVSQILMSGFKVVVQVAQVHPVRPAGDAIVVWAEILDEPGPIPTGTTRVDLSGDGQRAERRLMLDAKTVEQMLDAHGMTLDTAPSFVELRPWTR